MSKTNRDGKQLQRRLAYELDRDVSGSDIAAALGVSASWYTRNRDRDDFPSYEELGRIARHFNLDPIKLRIDLGALDCNEIQDYLDAHNLAVVQRDGPDDSRVRQDRSPL